MATNMPPPMSEREANVKLGLFVVAVVAFFLWACQRDPYPDSGPAPVWSTPSEAVSDPSADEVEGRMEDVVGGPCVGCP